MRLPKIRPGVCLSLYPLTSTEIRLISQVRAYLKVYLLSNGRVFYVFPIQIKSKATFLQEMYAYLIISLKNASWAKRKLNTECFYRKKRDRTYAYFD